MAAKQTDERGVGRISPTSGLFLYKQTLLANTVITEKQAYFTDLKLRKASEYRIEIYRFHKTYFPAGKVCVWYCQKYLFEMSGDIID